MHFITYSFLRFFGFLICLLPYRGIHAFGRLAGTAAYFLHRPFRKKALTNLAIAYGNTKSERERKKIALLSFQNLMITLLEFFCIKSKNLDKLTTLKDDQGILEILKKKQGIVFLTAHQANWEIPFVALTQKVEGVAIGRPIKNRWLYNWVLSVRESQKGKIIMPKNAIRLGLKALKEGKFLGIVGDQAYPDSSYHFPLFGTRAWTASTPALLAYKSNSPLVVGTTLRKGTHYEITSSPPIWPDLTKPVKEEVSRMMDLAMQQLQESIHKNPGQWMWVHDRWKQHTIDHVKRKYRYGFVLVTLPPDPSQILELLPTLRKIYHRAFITLMVPKGTKIADPQFSVIHYEKEDDLFQRDWRYQIVLDFYNSPKLRRHYKKLGAFKALHFPEIDAEILKRKLVKKECLTTVSI